MDWNKTKSMFIIVFLILDIYLLVQLYNQQRENQLATMKDPSKEERLKEANITWTSLPTEKMKGQYVSAKTKVFTNKDIKDLEKQNQSPTLIGPTKISSVFKKPIKIKGEIDPIQLESFLQENILNGEKYKYWNYDKDQKTIEFFQTYENKMIFKNKNGHVILYLNDNNEISSYEQTILEDIDKIEEKEVIPALNAIATLYEKGWLKENSKITLPELGYYTLIPETETQMLVPTWHFVVERDGMQESFYVNAIEGQVFPVNNNENQTLE